MIFDFFKIDNNIGILLTYDMYNGRMFDNISLSSS